jgi:hypothetical protein
MNPQVHAIGDNVLVENLEPEPHTVESASACRKDCLSSSAP